MRVGTGLSPTLALNAMCVGKNSVGRYTENTEYRSIEINTTSFLQIPEYRDRN